MSIRAFSIDIGTCPRQDSKTELFSGLGGNADHRSSSRPGTRRDRWEAGSRRRLPIPPEDSRAVVPCLPAAFIPNAGPPDRRAVPPPVCQRLPPAVPTWGGRTLAGWPAHLHTDQPYARSGRDPGVDLHCPEACTQDGGSAGAARAPTPTEHCEPHEQKEADTGAGWHVDLHRPAGGRPALIFGQAPLPRGEPACHRHAGECLGVGVGGVARQRARPASRPGSKAPREPCVGARRHGRPGEGAGAHHRQGAGRPAVLKEATGLQPGRRGLAERAITRLRSGISCIDCAAARTGPGTSPGPSSCYRPARPRLL